MKDYYQQADFIHIKSVYQLSLDSWRKLGSRFIVDKTWISAYFHTYQVSKSVGDQQIFNKSPDEVTNFLALFQKIHDDRYALSIEIG